MVQEHEKFPPSNEGNREVDDNDSNESVDVKGNPPQNTNLSKNLSLTLMIPHHACTLVSRDFTLVLRFI